MFFFFQSETQKRVREDIQKNMDICLENLKKYSQAMEVLSMHVNSSDQKSIEKIVDNIKATIKNQDLQPIRKYQSILLLKDLMKTHNKALGKYVVKKILKRLTILAQHKNGTKEEGDQERGRDIFGEVSSSQQAYSINFLNTLLTALQQWGTSWPKAPDGPYKDFHREYNQLVINGVKFPKKKPRQAPSPQPRNNSISPAGGNTLTGKSPISKDTIKEDLAVKEKKPKTSVPVKQAKKTLSPESIRQLTAFYDKVQQSMGLFNELLQSSTIQQFPLFRDIIGEIDKNSDKGTQLLLKLQKQSNPQSQVRKIQSFFTFLEKTQKDLNIVSKKPEKFDVFKTKYLKLAKACLELMSKQIKQKEKEDKINPNISVIQRQQPIAPKTQVGINPKAAGKKNQPIIKSQNRYLSVTGINVLPNPNQYGSGGQNGSVERFGSFGGINTERHRASIPLSSPRAQKQVSSDQKEPQSLTKEVQPFKPQPQKKKVAQNQNINKKPDEINVINQPKVQPERPREKVEAKPTQQNIDKSQDFFKQFPVDNKSNDLKATNPFKDNDSFGAFGKPVAVQNSSSHELDFFGKIDNQNKPANRQNVNHRRTNVSKQSAETDFFKPQMKSQLSDGLSAFQKKQNSQLSGNKIENKANQQTGSKKSMNFENPFENIFTGTKKQESRSQANSNKDQNPFSSNIFQRSGIFQNDTDSINKKFETGNFGKISTEKKKQSPQIKQLAPNPFETSSVKSKKNPFQSTGNPFQEDLFSKGSRRSKGSKNSQQVVQNPFQVQSVQRNLPNPFQGNNLPPQNPFQTSTQKSQKSNKALDDILQIFKAPTKKQIEDLSQRQSFKKIIRESENSKKGETNPPSVSSQNVRQSMVFSVNLHAQPEPGLRFSQFQDIAGQKPNNVRDSKINEHQQSGFSLSKFGDMNDPFAAAPGLKDTHDFFAAFENKSNKSKDSKSHHSSAKNVAAENKPDGFFQGFNQQTLFKRSSQQKDTKSVKRSFEEQKTVKSVSQKSFDFSKLQKTSNQQKQNENKQLSSKPLQFNDFPGLGKNNTESNKQLKQPIMIDIKSQKDLSWGDFDISANNMSSNQLNNIEVKRQESNAFVSKLLLVQSKKDFGSNNHIERSQDKESKNNKSSRQASVNIQLEDFAPISKKGTQWNPLSLIPNLKPTHYTYMVDEKKLALKKQELQEIKKQYDEKLQFFKNSKEKNDQIRSHLMQKTNKVEEIISQKGEYIQILKKLKQNNEIKQQHIQSINQRIKRVDQIKVKILQKEKKLFEITKSQLNQQDRKVAFQRSTASKWEMFNKSLEMHRNSSYMTATKLNNHGLSYF